MLDPTIDSAASLSLDGENDQADLRDGETWFSDSDNNSASDSDIATAVHDEMLFSYGGHEPDSALDSNKKPQHQQQAHQAHRNSIGHYLAAVLLGHEPPTRSASEVESRFQDVLVAGLLCRVMTGNAQASLDAEPQSALFVYQLARSNVKASVQLRELLPRPMR